VPRARALPPGWVLPWWLERRDRTRGDGSDRQPGAGAGAVPPSTRLGNLSSAHEPSVDPRGLVTPRPGGWSLDWWIGADDRWHLPSRERGAAVRQRLLDNAPVVETAMRVPSGDAYHRAYAITASRPGGRLEEHVVVEIENRSPLPCAVALAVRPYGASGVARVSQIERDGGTSVLVDGRVGLVFSRPPALAELSTGTDGDSAAAVLAGRSTAAGDGAAGTLRERVRCDAGLAQAAFVFPLAHGATLRVALPLDGRAATGFPSAVPSAATVAHGWTLQMQRGMRVELPDRALDDAVAANRCFLLLVAASAPDSPADAARLATVLEQWGFDAEAAEVRGGRRAAPSRWSRWLAGRRSRTSPETGRPAPDPVLSPRRALDDAAGEIDAGDRQALDRLASVVEAATTTWTWAEVVDGDGRGHDGGTVVEFLAVVRHLLIRETPHELLLCPMVPDDWLGHPLQVVGAPTRHGDLSFAVRWHGPRPALLWELTPTARTIGAGPRRLRLSAPGLDPSWSTDRPSGEQLLQPVAGAERTRT
jgi:hypothetical protein